MAAFFTLGEIISGTSGTSTTDSRDIADGKTHRSGDKNFDTCLGAKLDHPLGISDRQPGDSSFFNGVRTLFANAAKALESELNHQQDKGTIALATEDAKSTSSHCHWVPGRIEVMGKHTDYAGGNSLVCATAGRGMAMVSTFIRNDDECNQSGMRVTIVSVLPLGMEHHATKTAAPYQVEGRPVVQHTINIPEFGKEFGDNCPEKGAVDWTIYPTTVIHRLHRNFGLFPHSDEANTTSNDTRAANGGHIFISISSNLPPASGLSTSSALVTGLFLALDSHLQLAKSHAYRHAIVKDDDKGTVYNLSTYLGNVENGRDYINKERDAILKGTAKGGVGTFGGSEDHAAILTGRSNELRLFSFCPTRPASFNMEKIVRDGISDDLLGKSNLNSLEPSTQGFVVQLPSDLSFVIAYSGAKAEKAGGEDGATEASVGYNSASDLARKAFDAYAVGSGDSKAPDGIETLADAIRWERVSGSNRQTIKESISRQIKAGALAIEEKNLATREEYSAELVQRFEHFYAESEYLVPFAACAISKERYDLLGPIVDASHNGAVNLLKNQIEETAWLPLWARGIEIGLNVKPLSVAHTKQFKSREAVSQPQRIRALAASAFGAGFGGSCWALVYRCQARDFAQQWRNAYDSRFPAKEDGSRHMREFFVTCPGPGAFYV